MESQQPDGSEGDAGVSAVWCVVMRHAGSEETPCQRGLIRTGGQPRKMMICETESESVYGTTCEITHPSSIARRRQTRLLRDPIGRRRRRRLRNTFIYIVAITDPCAATTLCASCETGSHGFGGREGDGEEGRGGGGGVEKDRSVCFHTNDRCGDRYR